MIDIDLLLAWGATYKKVSAGEIIFREGTQASFYHQLVSGRVKWVNITDDGREFIQVIAEPGECFGEFPMFDGEPYAASAFAEEDSIIIRLHQYTFHQLLKEYPEIHFKFSAMLTQRLRFKFMLLKEIACSDPAHRIETLLNYMKKSAKNICPKCSKVNLTRQQIADMTGLRVETVIRTIRHLHDKGALMIQRGKVFC